MDPAGAIPRLRRAIARAVVSLSLLLFVIAAVLWVWSSFRTLSIGRYWCSAVREHAEPGLSEVSVIQLSAACVRGHAQIGLASHPSRRDQFSEDSQWPPSGLSTMSFLPQTRSAWAWFLWEMNDRGGTCVLLKGVEVGWRRSETERTLYVFAQARVWMVMVIVSTPALIAGRSLAVRRWREWRKRCPGCAYPRAGLDSDAPCPECGLRHFGHDAPSTMLIDATSPNRADVDPHGARDDQSARPA